MGWLIDQPNGQSDSMGWLIDQPNDSLTNKWTSCLMEVKPAVVGIDMILQQMTGWII